MYRYRLRYSYIPLPQHDPEVNASLFVTKYRHAPDSKMTKGTAPGFCNGTASQYYAIHHFAEGQCHTTDI